MEQFMETVDLFVECMEENNDSNKLAERLIQSGQDREMIHEAQTAASEAFAKMY